MPNDPESLEKQKYQEDAFAWLKRNFNSLESEVKVTIRLHREWLEKRMKTFVQNATEQLVRNSMETRDTPSGVLSATESRVRNSMLTEEWFALDRFRGRFRDLLDKKYDDADLPKEDIELLEKYEDSILYPLAVSYAERSQNDAIPRRSELEYIEMLYREHCDTKHDYQWRDVIDQPPSNQHPYFESHKKHLADCELCAVALRVTQHLKEVLAKFEAAIGAAGNNLNTEAADKEWVAKSGNYYANLIRRIVERRNAEAVFGELFYMGSAGRGMLDTLGEKLKAYGFDREMLRKETEKWAPQLKKFRGGKGYDEWDKIRERESDAMLAFVEAEEHLNEQRYEEWRRLPGRSD